MRHNFLAQYHGAQMPCSISWAQLPCSIPCKPSLKLKVSIDQPSYGPWKCVSACFLFKAHRGLHIHEKVKHTPLEGRTNTLQMLNLDMCRIVYFLFYFTRWYQGAFHYHHSIKREELRPDELQAHQGGLIP